MNDNNTVILTNVIKTEKLSIECLSPTFELPYTNADGVEFLTAYQHIQYSKAKLFRDLSAMKDIASCSSYDYVLRRGKAIKKFDNNLWKSYKNSILFQVNLDRVSDDKRLLDILMATERKFLVYQTSTDFDLGNGTAYSNRFSAHKWRGDNAYGKSLEQVREFLRSM